MIIVSKTKQGITSLEYILHNRKGKFTIHDTIKDVFEEHGIVDKKWIEKKNDCVRIRYGIDDEGSGIDEYCIYIVLVDG